MWVLIVMHVVMLSGSMVLMWSTGEPKSVLWYILCSVGCVFGLSAVASLKGYARSDTACKAKAVGRSGIAGLIVSLVGVSVLVLCKQVPAAIPVVNLVAALALVWFGVCLMFSRICR